MDSVLSQSLPPDEVIVYDDGSTDASLEILRDYGARLRLIAGTHVAGRAAIAAQCNAVAAAFSASSAEHLYLLDGDDKFLPDKLSAYEKVWAGKPNAMLVQSPMILVDATGSALGDNYEKNKHHTDFRRATYAQQDTDFYYPTSALAFHRDYLARELPLDDSILRDAPVDARLRPGAAFFGPVLTLEECHSWWRQRAGSISSNPGQRDPLSATRLRNRVFNDFARRHGFRPIRLGLNRRFYKQVARRIMPDWVSSPFVRNPEGQR
jgi:glycosyltransferase involved in cell wall biosynthesis